MGANQALQLSGGTYTVRLAPDIVWLGVDVVPNSGDSFTRVSHSRPARKRYTDADWGMLRHCVSTTLACA